MVPSDRIVSGGSALRPALGEADLPPLYRGVVEGGDDDELVAVPLGGLAELDVERLSGRGITVPSGRVITEAGRRTREGQSQNQIADELRPAIEAVLDDLNAWLTSATDQHNRNRAT